MRLLLIEDDKNLGQATAEGLRESFAVDWVRSAEEGEEALATTRYDLLVLDINLTGMSGLDLLGEIRKKKDQTPVLLLTARDAVRHRVEGLNAGADDYLVKPFDLDELLARCAALIRRRQGHAEPVLSIGAITFEPASGRLEKDGVAIALSGRERAVFEVLINNTGRPVSRAMIEERVYDWHSGDIESNTIEVHVASLRRKLGHAFIKTIRNVGYMVVEDHAR